MAILETGEIRDYLPLLGGKIDDGVIYNLIVEESAATARLLGMESIAATDIEAKGIVRDRVVSRLIRKMYGSQSRERVQQADDLWASSKERIDNYRESLLYTTSYDPAQAMVANITSDPLWTEQDFLLPGRWSLTIGPQDIR